MIRLLKTFVAIAETGSFVGAADKVFVTPAAVSQQMKRLEDELQIILFSRAGRSPEMTHAALSLVPQARDIIQRCEQMVASARSKSLLAGEMRIGAVPSLMQNLVPLSLKNLKNDFPGVHIRIIPSLSDQLFAHVERGVVDAAIMSKPQRIGASFRWHPLADETLMLATHQHITDKDVRMILTNRPYLRMARTAWVSSLADDILEELGLSLVDAMELDSLETIYNMIVHDLGVAIIPKPCFDNYLSRQIRFIPIGKVPRTRNIGVLSRKDSQVFPLIDAFQSALGAVFDKDKFG